MSSFFPEVLKCFFPKILLSFSFAIDCVSYLVQFYGFSEISTEFLGVFYGIYGVSMIFLPDFKEMSVIFLWGY